MDYKKVNREEQLNVQKNEFMNAEKQDQININSQINPIMNEQQQNVHMFGDFEVVEKEESQKVVNNFLKLHKEENKKQKENVASKEALVQFKELHATLEANRDDSDKTHTYIPMLTACWRVINEWYSQDGQVIKQNITELKNAAKAFLDCHKGFAFTSRGRARKKAARTVFEKITNLENDIFLGEELDSQTVEKVNMDEIIKKLYANKEIPEGAHADVDVDELIRKYDPVTKQRMDDEERVKLYNEINTPQQVLELNFKDTCKWGQAFAELSNLQETLPEFTSIVSTLNVVLNDKVIPASVNIIKGDTTDYSEMEKYLATKFSSIVHNASDCFKRLDEKNSPLKKDADIIKAFIAKVVSPNLFNMIRAEVLTSRGNNSINYAAVRDVVDTVKLEDSGSNLATTSKNVTIIGNSVNRNAALYTQVINAEVNKDMFDLSIKHAEIENDINMKGMPELEDRRERLCREIRWKKDEEINRVLRSCGITSDKFEPAYMEAYRNSIKALIDKCWNENEDRFAEVIKTTNHDVRFEKTKVSFNAEYEANLKDFLENYRDLDNESLIKKMDDVGILKREFEDKDNALYEALKEKTKESDKEKLRKKHEQDLSKRMRYINSVLGQYRSKSDKSLDAMIRNYRGNNYDKSYLGEEH